MYYFRVEGNSRIGMGHLMRSLCLAGALDCCEDIRFCCHEDAALRFVSSRDFHTIRLEEPPFSEADKDILLDILREDAEAVVILDSYEYNNEYVKALRDVAKVICFDDLIQIPFEADAVINYNSYATATEYEALYTSRNLTVPNLLIGSTFLPLREEFTKYRNQDKQEPKNIFLSTGGGDADNLSGQIATKLDSLLVSKGLKLHIVCGALNPNFETLTKLSLENEYIFIHRDVKNMSELMNGCDVAISAAGSTCYELCAMGLPFVIFAYADNQKRILEDMVNKRAALDAGYMETSNQTEIFDNILKQLILLLEDEALRDEMIDIEHKLVDGQGAKRLAMAIKAL